MAEISITLASGHRITLSNIMFANLSISDAPGSSTTQPIGNSDNNSRATFTVEDDGHDTSDTNEQVIDISDDEDVISLSDNDVISLSDDDVISISDDEVIEPTIDEATEGEINNEYPNPFNEDFSYRPMIYNSPFYSLEDYENNPLFDYIRNYY